MEGPTGISKTLQQILNSKSLGKNIIKYHLNVETKINDLLIKYISDSESSTGLTLKLVTLLNYIKKGNIVF